MHECIVQQNFYVWKNISLQILSQTFRFSQSSFYVKRPEIKTSCSSLTPRKFSLPGYLPGFVRRDGLKATLPIV